MSGQQRRRIFVTSCCFVSSVSLGAQSPSRQLGERMYSERKFAEAKQALVQPAAAGDSWAQFWLARIALDENLPDSAETMLRRAANSQDSVSEFHGWLGFAQTARASQANALMRPILVRDALKELRRAADLSPSNVTARVQLLEILVRAPGFMGGDRDEARVRVEEIRRFNPYIGGLKAAWLAEDDRAMAVAEREYRQLIQTFPDSFAPPNQLGDVLTRQQRWDDAFKLFDDRLKTRPNEGIALFGLGKAASLSGRRMEEGISTLTRYLTLPVPPGAPTHAAAHYRIGVIEQRRGNTDAARREYQAALNLNPRYEDAKRALASLP